MTDNILSVPPVTKQPGQRSLSAEDAYFTRFVPSWSFPSGLSPSQWRLWVKTQPVAMNCKDTLITSLQSLDWKISPRESDMRDELRATVKHYTRLFEQGGYWLGLDWTGFLEWLMNDLQDLPFGAAAEIGRKGDAPGGRVLWIKPLDAGTLYPTLNKDYPVMQYYASAVQAINFPAHSIARMYMNPRPEIEREGWGMAPPERIYMAMEMLARGDMYYANLLLDVPPAGILDLGDMEKESALDWVKSFKTFIANGGVDGFKIPVLYEHTNKTEFIPFGKVPNDIMYNEITLKYAAIITASYGMSLGDIGLQTTTSSGETLAGGIRSERRTRRTGLARAKRKLKFFLESILPDTLQFDFVDMDDELATALGRARLANATAWGQLIDKGIFDRKEARLQTIQDGLVSISVPEEPPSEDDWAKMKSEMAMKQAQAKFGAQPNKPNKSPERPGMLGNPQPPSQGGDGEVKKSASFSVLPSSVEQIVSSIVDAFLPIVRNGLDINEDHEEVMRAHISNAVFSDEDELGFTEALIAILNGINPVTALNLSALGDEIVDTFIDKGMYPTNIEEVVENLQEKCKADFPLFIGKSILHILINSDIRSNNVKEDVSNIVQKAMSEYISTFLSIEVNNAVEDLKFEVPREIKTRSIVKYDKAPAPNVYVSGPEITMPEINFTAPEKSVTIENNSPITVNAPEQPAPIVNFTAPEQPAPVVNVTVPERGVHVDGPVVNLSVPDVSPSVNVNVLPTPVSIENKVDVQPADVKLPKLERSEDTVTRDASGNISGKTTEYKYEDK